MNDINENIPALIPFADLPEGYADLLREVKQHVTNATVRRVRADNSEMINLYWEIGRSILDRQQVEGWGTKVLDRLAADLKAAYPRQRGFSRSNLKYMRQFAEAWPEGIGQRAIGQLAWGQVIDLISKLKEPADQDFYAAMALRDGWSRNVLAHQIATGLKERIGSAPNTFHRTIPPEDQDAVRELVRDPYRLDFTGRSDTVVEYALRGAQTPIAVGIHTYQSLPEDVRKALPDAGELKHVVQQVVESRSNEEVC